MTTFPTYTELSLLVAPVLLVFALGVAVRRAGWLTADAEGGLLKLLMNVFYPALILRSVLGNTALREPGNLLWPPLVGFGTVVAGMLIGLLAGRLIKLHVGEGLRTFAFAVGIYNYAYIPIPLVASLFGPESAGILLVHNIGCELAVWSVGILLLAGVSPREGWRRLANPSLGTLVAAALINASGWAPPGFFMKAVEGLAACAVPIGLICSGASVEAYLRAPRDLFSVRVTSLACALRLGVLPVVFLLLARAAPFTPELKQVMLVQAAMPAAMIPLVIARHHGGRPLIAAQVILGTTALGVLLIPGLLRLGLVLVGLRISP